MEYQEAFMEYYHVGNQEPPWKDLEHTAGETVVFEKLTLETVGKGIPRSLYERPAKLYGVPGTLLWNTRKLV